MGRNEKGVTEKSFLNQELELESRFKRDFFKIFFVHGSITIGNKDKNGQRY